MTVTVNDGHTFGEWQSNGDGTHTRKCTADGCNGIETKDCSGGNATCTEKPVCENCGKAYGELDPNNHTDLEHNDARAATEDAEGNTEYWHCGGCNKYYRGKDGTKEIAKADTVTAKLPKSPKTGDTSNLGAWWLENKLDCSLPYEIDEFFDYAGYGESIAENNDGEFVEGLGFVCMEEGYTLEDVLQDMDQGMGGM